jgi:hypothetical protein
VIQHLPATSIGLQLDINITFMKKIKVNYDPTTTLIKGYYPDSIQYNSIPEPFVEINENEQILSKKMCVIDGIYQEYVRSPIFILSEKRTLKIAEIKSIRDSKNIDPIKDHQAPVLDENGDLGESRFFLFHTTRHPSNPAADPAAILGNAVLLGSTNYFTRDLEGNKICVQIDAEIAKSLLSHLKNRNENNFKLAEAIISAINACESAEELENIDWNPEFLA